MLFSALIVGLALLAGAKGVANTASECPKNVPRHETVQIPHENDCTKFYSCLGNTKIPRDCPFMDNQGNRLFFNAKLQLCDWPSEANCNLPLPIRAIKNTMTIKKSSLPCDPPTECPTDDPKNATILLAHEKNCTKFYACSHGRKIEMSCSGQGDETLYFDPCEQICRWPSDIDCYTTNETEPLYSKLSTLNSRLSETKVRAAPISRKTSLPHEPTTRYPDTTTRHPYPTTRYPDTTTRHPYPTTRHPYPTTRYPYPTTRHPYPTTRYPDTTTRHPYPTTRHPYPTTRYPDTTTRHPYPTTFYPYTETTTFHPYPETTTFDPYPDTTTRHPSTSKTTYDPVTTTTETSTQRPTITAISPTVITNYRFFLSFNLTRAEYTKKGNKSVN